MHDLCHGLPSQIRGRGQIGSQPYILQETLNKLEQLSRIEAGQEKAIRKVKGIDGTFIGAALVEGACQEGGFSLVGLTCTTDFNFSEVFYNKVGITALAQLKKLFQALYVGCVRLYVHPH